MKNKYCSILNKRYWIASCRAVLAVAKTGLNVQNLDAFTVIGCQTAL